MGALTDVFLSLHSGVSHDCTFVSFRVPQFWHWYHINVHNILVPSPSWKCLDAIVSFSKYWILCIHRSNDVEILELYCTFVSFMKHSSTSASMSKLLLTQSLSSSSSLSPGPASPWSTVFSALKEVSRWLSSGSVWYKLSGRLNIWNKWEILDK